jgi:adenylylsulfate kinase
MRRSPDMAAPVVWFTGLSGSGKTTIARQVCRKLEQVGLPVEYLDGDAIRSVFPNTGFSRVDRDAHIRRVAFMASRLEHHGIAVVVSLVSPYLASRAFARNVCRNFVEVHVSTPLAVCEARDVKGLYAKARRGEIRNFTGLDDPYEPPEKPELELDTSTMSLEEATSLVMGRIGFGYRPAERPTSKVEREPNPCR